jgi:pimeloyl-ACP methyl ester carboxylesterase
MRYLRAGSGPALILLHGLLGYSFSWRYTLPALAPYFTVYAPDMMGAGFSDRVAGIDHSMRASALRVLRFIAALGITSFDLLGTSHGGAGAMMVAAECVGAGCGGGGDLRPDTPGPHERARVPVPTQALPTQALPTQALPTQALPTQALPTQAVPTCSLRRLILVAPVNPYSAHGRRMAPFAGSRFGTPLFRFGMMHMNFLHSYFHSRLYADRSSIPSDALAGYKAPLAKPGLFEHALSIVHTWTADLRELESVLPKLANVRTLLMWGERDPAVYASSAKRLTKYFHNSKLILFPGIGHLPYEECPVEFNRALIEFLGVGVS